MFGDMGYMTCHPVIYCMTQLHSQNLLSILTITVLTARNHSNAMVIIMHYAGSMGDKESYNYISSIR